MSPRALVVVSPRPAVTGLAVRSVHLTPGWRRCGQLRPAHRSPVGITITSGQSRLKAAGNRSSVSKRDLGRTIDISLETSLVHGGGRPANNGYPRPDAARRSGLEAIACTPWVRQSNYSICRPLARVRPWSGAGRRRPVPVPSLSCLRVGEPAALQLLRRHAGEIRLEVQDRGAIQHVEAADV